MANSILFSGVGKSGYWLFSTNLYHPMMKVLSDDVGEHDLLHPCCRPEMYDFFYHNGEGHPNCFDNINKVLKERRAIIKPVNLSCTQKLTLMDITLGAAACSVSESKCSSGKCSSIKIVVE